MARVAAPPPPRSKRVARRLVRVGPHPSTCATGGFSDPFGAHNHLDGLPATGGCAFRSYSPRLCLGDGDPESGIMETANCFP